MDPLALLASLCDMATQLKPSHRVRRIDQTHIKHVPEFRCDPKTCFLVGSNINSRSFLSSSKHRESQEQIVLVRTK